MEKFVMAGKTAIRYRDMGIGERVIVLLHGYLESLEVWDDFAGELGKEFRVISFDLPGHGISEVLGTTHTMEFLADTLNSLLEKIGVDSVNVIGHSFGGYVALAFAKKYSNKCNSIVLFHSTCDSDTPERKKLREREIDIIKSGRKELLTTVNPGKCFAPQNRKRYISVIYELSEQAMLTEDDGIIAILNGIAEREPMNDFLHESPIKQLFIFGKHDEFMPLEYCEEVANNNPQARIEWLDNSGHIGFVEEFAKSVEIVKDFLN